MRESRVRIPAAAEFLTVYSKYSCWNRLTIRLCTDSKSSGNSTTLKEHLQNSTLLLDVWFRAFTEPRLGERVPGRMPAPEEFLKCLLEVVEFLLMLEPTHD